MESKTFQNQCRIAPEGTAVNPVRKSISTSDFFNTVLRTSKAHSLVYMSVPKPDLFTAALSNHFSPSTTFLGLVAAPTHFITNRPVTLFFDDRIYGDGSVGLALVEKEDQKPQVPELETEFVGSQKFGKIMTFTRYAC